MEEEKFRQLLEKIKEDTHNNDNIAIVSPLVLILDDVLNSLGTCGVENTNTYFFSAQTRDVIYKLRITFDPKYTNIFTKSDIVNAIQSINLEVKRKT